MAIFEPQQEGQTLTKFKNILHGVYWDQFQGFKEPARRFAKRVISKSRSNLISMVFLPTSLIVVLLFQLKKSLYLLIFSGIIYPPGEGSHPTYLTHTFGL
jgi:hypothetical protein